jgi:hypothetical protein
MPDPTDSNLGNAAAPPQPSDGDKPTAVRRFWLLVRAHPRTFAYSLVMLAYPFAFGLLLDLVGTRAVPHDFMTISCQVLAVLILALTRRSTGGPLTRLPAADIRRSPDTCCHARCLARCRLVPAW